MDDQISGAVEAVGGTVEHAVAQVVGHVGHYGDAMVVAIFILLECFGFVVLAAAVIPMPVDEDGSHKLQIGEFAARGHAYRLVSAASVIPDVPIVRRRGLPGRRGWPWSN